MRRKLQAAKRRLLILFKNIEDENTIPYKGIYVDSDLRVRTRSTSLLKYIEDMQTYTKTNASLVNVCWGIQLDTISFEYIGAPERVGMINGKTPKNSKISASAQKDYYHVYKGVGYIKEEVTFFQDNVVKNVPICKAITFYLRYLEVITEDGTIGYDWVTYIHSIRSSEKYTCGSIKDFQM